MKWKVEGMEDSVSVRRVSVIESRINGTFEGWSGDTTFRLQNGQLWQQASYAYWYHYAYRPEIIVYESSGGYTLRLVDDDSNVIQVQRIHSRIDPNYSRDGYVLRPPKLAGEI